MSRAIVPWLAAANIVAYAIAVAVSPSDEPLWLSLIFGAAVAGPSR